jgi:hypothetical protein
VRWPPNKTPSGTTGSSRTMVRGGRCSGRG